VPVNLPDGDKHIDQHSRRDEAGEQAGDDQDAAKKFCSRQQIGRPTGEAEVLHHVVNMRKSAEHLAIAMGNHDGADHEAQSEKSQRLQTIKKAQDVSSREEVNRLPHFSWGAKVKNVDGQSPDC